MEYRIAGFLEQCCDVFSEQFHVSIDKLKVGKASTPFVGESPREIHQCPGRCSMCKSVCCSGNYAKIRREEQQKRAKDKERHPS
eukprot:9115847-Alexandrium_andersonii.AAC.1